MIGPEIFGCEIPQFSKQKFVSFFVARFFRVLRCEMLFFSVSDRHPLCCLSCWGQLIDDPHASVFFLPPSFKSEFALELLDDIFFCNGLELLLPDVVFLLQVTPAFDEEKNVVFSLEPDSTPTDFEITFSCMFVWPSASLSVVFVQSFTLKHFVVPCLFCAPRLLNLSLSYFYRLLKRFSFRIQFTLTSTEEWPSCRFGVEPLLKSG